VAVVAGEEMFDQDGEAFLLFTIEVGARAADFFYFAEDAKGVEA
jgi:hypothetical protein